MLFSRFRRRHAMLGAFIISLVGVSFVGEAYILIIDRLCVIATIVATAKEFDLV